MTTKFSVIKWGADAAEQDSNLHNYFFRIPRFDEVVSGNIRYIVGRKGTGKTAVFEKLNSDFDNDPMNSVINLSFGDFPLNDLTSIKDKSEGDKYQYIPIWRFLILTELAKGVIKDQSVRSYDERTRLTEFLEQNFPNEFSISDTISYLRSNESKLNIKPDFLELGSSTSEEKSFTGTIHYKKAADHLMKILSRISTDVSYYILFDGLDEGFKTSNKSLNLLLISLISAVEKLSVDFSYCHLNFRPILGLRPDVLDSVGSNNLNKIDDYKLNLDWNSRNLKRLISLRILASSEDDVYDHDEDSIWFNVVEKSNLKGKSIWHYILERTLMRPRDIIKFLKYCQRSNTSNTNGKLDIDQVKEAEVEYSDWLYNEYKDEIYSIMPLDVWSDSMEVLSIVGKKIPYKNEVLDEFKKDKTIVKWCENGNHEFEDLLKIFYDYSIIGRLGPKNRIIYRYQQKSKWRSYNRIPIHLGLHKRLNLTKFNFFLVSGLVLDENNTKGNFFEFLSFSNSIFSVETEYHKTEECYNAYIRVDIDSIKNVNVKDDFSIGFSAILLDKRKIPLKDISFSVKNGTRSYKRLLDIVRGKIEQTFVKLDGDIKIAKNEEHLSDNKAVAISHLREKLNQNAKYIRFKGHVTA